MPTVQNIHIIPSISSVHTSGATSQGDPSGGARVDLLRHLIPSRGKNDPSSSSFSSQTKPNQTKPNQTKPSKLICSWFPPRQTLIVIVLSRLHQLICNNDLNLNLVSISIFAILRPAQSDWVEIQCKICCSIFKCPTWRLKWMTQ